MAGVNERWDGARRRKEREGVGGLSNRLLIQTIGLGLGDGWRERTIDPRTAPVPRPPRSATPPSPPNTAAGPGLRSQRVTRGVIPQRLCLSHWATAGQW